MAAARCDGDRDVVLAVQGGNRQFQVAPGVDEFDAVTHREAVLHFDLGQSGCVVGQHIADIQAAVGFGMAFEVVLVFAVRVALVEAAGVAAVGEAVEFAQQGGVERTAGDGVVDGPGGSFGRCAPRSRAIWCGLRS